MFIFLLNAMLPGFYAIHSQYIDHYLLCAWEPMAREVYMECYV